MGNQIRIMSFIRKNLKAIILTLVLIICIQSCLNLKIKKIEEKEKEGTDYIARMKQFFELGMDKQKLASGKAKLCWNWMWDGGFETNPNIKATVKQIKEGDVKKFLTKPNTTTIDVAKCTKVLVLSVSDNVKTNNESIACKTELEKCYGENNLNMSELINKMKNIFDVNSAYFSGNKGFITSAAFVHKDLSIRNPDLFKILNSN